MQILEVFIMTEVINIANFKGGVGKTTITVMLSLLLSKKGKRSLTLIHKAMQQSFYIIKTLKMMPRKSLYLLSYKKMIYL